jgi:8-oxo-dGTP pyrophosphatase MutT (NUDIX family)
MGGAVNSGTSGLAEALRAYAAQSADEAVDVQRLRELVASVPDPWTRASPLHVTGSALVLDPASQRVLLRWHDRMQSWLQVGGHADPGETDPFRIASREAREETGLPDLEPWPDPEQPRILQVTVVPVPAGKGEPEHHHGDIRYLLATRMPDAVKPESDSAELAWLDLEHALERVAEDNLRIALIRTRAMLQK